MPRFGEIWENRRAVGYCTFVCLSATSFGFSTGVLIGFESFRIQFGRKYEDTYVIPAIYQSLWNCMAIPGGLIGALCASFVGNLFGRRLMFFAGSFFMLCAALAQQLALDWKVLLGGRILSAVGASIYFVAMPTYISEVAPAGLRGMLLAQITFYLLLGQFFTGCVLKGTQTLSGNLQFRIPMALQYIVPGIILVSCWFLPESPSWLVENQQIEAARASQIRLYGTRPDLEEQLLELQNASSHERTPSLTKYINCFKGSNLKRTIITVGIYFCQQLTGVYLIVYYSSYFFLLSGVPESQAFTMTSVMFGLQLLANILSWYFIEKFGRRALLLTGMTVIIVAYFIIGGLGASGTYTSGPIPKAIVSFMVLIPVASQLSLGSVVWAIGGEISSLELRASTQSIAAAFNATVGFGFTFSLPYMINPDQRNLGPKIGFVFGGFSIVAIIFIYFMVPEAKGRRFVELDYMFQNGVPIRGFKGFRLPEEEEVRDVEAKT